MQPIGTFPASAKACNKLAREEAATLRSSSPNSKQSTALRIKKLSDCSHFYSNIIPECHG
jgi:hypothetical protein